MNKLQTLKGFRDFLPSDAIIRKRLIEKITQVFEQFGYDPLETPALEYAEVLMGKYGEDADKLLYTFEDRGGRNIGLRYDQTVPLARIAAQYNEIPKPFKRYQIQPVWRAENTQKGRYREFLQCDADIIGDTSPAMADAEILALFWNIYNKIGFKDIKIVVNSRLVLKELITQSMDESDIPQITFLSVVRSIDKMDKIGEEGVKTELLNKGIPEEQISKLFSLISEWSALNFENLSKAGDSQLTFSIETAINNFNIPKEKIIFDPKLARGLDYYTGIIFEAVLDNTSGSLGGGGRYDNLINQFVGKPLSAVGFAIGFDRTLEAAKELKLISEETTVTRVLVAYKDNNDNVLPTALNITTALRETGVNTELFLDPKKDLDKQLKYANKKGIRFVLIIGEEEIKKNTIKLKDMKTGDQEEKDLQTILNLIKNL
ncbi:MAG TPA: histidine--tRNA ligase [Candidatus Woesebacteria bacterium]|nr:histidine--tRNA ligase [Candidatus Woesebacteria bacterium]